MVFENYLSEYVLVPLELINNTETSELYFKQYDIIKSVYLTTLICKIIIEASFRFTDFLHFRKAKKDCNFPLQSFSYF